MNEIIRSIANMRRPALLYTMAVSGILFLWMGALKFYPYEAAGTVGLMKTNILTSWLITLFGEVGAAHFIGVTEMLAGIFLLVGLRSPLAAFFGAGIVCASLVVTTSMFLTVPVFEEGLGFPALNGLPGQFLAKDPVLFATNLAIMVASARQFLTEHLSAAEGAS